MPSSNEQLSAVDVLRNEGLEWLDRVDPNKVPTEWETNWELLKKMPGITTSTVLLATQYWKGAIEMVYSVNGVPVCRRAIPTQHQNEYTTYVLYLPTIVLAQHDNGDWYIIDPERLQTCFAAVNMPTEGLHA